MGLVAGRPHVEPASPNGMQRGHHQSPPPRSSATHCDSRVRVPADRLADGPKCPRCHEALFDGHPVSLTTANFDQHVANGDVPVVVDFWAPWCGPCRAMAPVFEQAAGRVEPAARFAKVNTDEAQDIAARYGIRSIPTLMVFKGGREVARQAGRDGPGGVRSLAHVRAVTTGATLFGRDCEKGSVRLTSSTISRSFASTCSPGRATTSLTRPSRSARTLVSIFIASIVTSTSPRATVLTCAHVDRRDRARHRRADVFGLVGFGLAPWRPLERPGCDPAPAPSAAGRSARRTPSACRRRARRSSRRSGRSGACRARGRPDLLARLEAVEERRRRQHARRRRSAGGPPCSR